MPLWRQLHETAAVLQAVRGGASATPALAAVAAPLRAGVQSLVFHVLRHLGRAEALRSQLAKRAPPPAADALLCVALALCSDPDSAPYEPFTLVNQTVEAAKQDRQTEPQAAFINACLRRFLRERDALMQATDSQPVAQWNHPRWWIERLQRDHPQRWQDILRASNSQPPMTLRVNARQATVAQAQEALALAGIGAAPVGRHGLILERPRPVHELPGFERGLLSVQDAAAQMAAPLLLGSLPPAASPSRLRILDACAAPGGKTAHLLELADCDVTALDVDPVRCQRVEATLARIGAVAQVVVGDAANPPAWWDGQPFEAILLDAPCTASGIVRRHPDVRWLRRESDIAALAATQARLLAALWPLLRPGGVLLYCTCSVFLAEGQGQIASFRKHNTEALLLASPGHLTPQSGAKRTGVPDNLPSDHDGFYYALLQKRPSADTVA